MQIEIIICLRHKLVNVMSYFKKHRIQQSN